jgi:hypothetical protein
MIGPTGGKHTAAEAFEAWKAWVANIGPGSPCPCTREYVCQGCEAMLKLAAAAARIEADERPDS